MTRPGAPAAKKERPPAAPRYIRTAWQSVAVLGFGGFWYMRNLELNRRDWDLEWDQASWRRKAFTFEGVRFDSNDFVLNAVKHTAAGVVFYQVGRGNGLGIGTSILTNFASTAAWEYLIEWREYPSINDFSVNLVGGLALGEPLVQLGDYFRRGTPNIGNRIAAFLVSPVASINDWIEGRKWARTDVVDDLGLSRARWRRLRTSLGAGWASFDGAPSQGETSFGFEADLVMQLGYARPGAFSTWITPGAWSGITGSWAVDSGAGFTSGRLSSQVVTLGRYVQSFAADDVGRPVGTGVLLGLGSGFDLDARKMSGGWDRVATFEILGPRLEVVVAPAGWLWVRLRAGASFDFGLVDAFALMQGDASALGGRPMTTVENWGYYYAYGYTAGGGLDVLCGPFELQLGGRRSSFVSLDGRDRYQDLVTSEVSLTDQRSQLAALVAVQATRAVRLSVEARRAYRDGQMAGVSAAGEERAATMRLGTTF